MACLVTYNRDDGSPVAINNAVSPLDIPLAGGVHNLKSICNGRETLYPCDHTDTPPMCSINPQAVPEVTGEYNIEIFTNDVESPVTIKSIDFGDGSPVDASGNANYNHNYGLGQQYTVTVTVSDGVNPDETCTVIISVPAENQPPECGFVAQIVNNRVQIASTSHSDPDGDPTTVWYNLINTLGQVVESWNGQGGYPHNFGASLAGSYTVTQIVNDGNSSTVCSATGLEILPENNPPTCGFTAESTGTQIRVLTSSAGDVDGDTITTLYELLDDTSAVVESVTNPTLAYAFLESAAGDYTIRQTVTDGNGGTSICTSETLTISGELLEFSIVIECVENT